VISSTKVTYAVPESSIVDMASLTLQVVFRRDDIATIGVREIVWDIHSALEGVVALRRRSDAPGPPASSWLYNTSGSSDIPN